MLNYYQYSAFGETIISEETTQNRLRYNAQTEDELTGLYYLRARYYAPNIGRFTQEDVIYHDGLNLYAYCDSNPVMYCDPSGFALSPSDERAITLTMEASRDPALVQAAKDGNIELLKKKHALADTSGDFDGLVILKGNTPRDKKAMELLNFNGLDGIYYKSGKPEFGSVSLFQVNIPNMGVNRGKIGQFFDGTGSNYGQYKQGVAEAIFSAKGDYDKLYKMNIIPPNQTKYTADKAQEFLNDIKKNYRFDDIEEISDIHKELGEFIHRNKYTIHEAFDPLAQSPPGIINSTYNHEGGVAEKGGCKKK